MFVYVYENLPGADGFAEELRELGVQVPASSLPFGMSVKGFDLGLCEVIAIGCSVDPHFAIPILKLGIERFPGLKYWYLSSEDKSPMSPVSDHYRIAFGYNNKVVEKVGLREWTSEEVSHLADDMSVEEFHYLIRASLKQEPTTLITFIGGIHDGQVMQMDGPAKAICDFVYKSGFHNVPRQNEPNASDLYEMKVVGDYKIEGHFKKTIKLPGTGKTS